VLSRAAQLGDKPALIDSATGRTLTYAGLGADIAAKRFEGMLPLRIVRGFRCAQYRSNAQ
jgi:hypothetical protein